jgi:hypothetical protein
MVCLKTLSGAQAVQWKSKAIYEGSKSPGTVLKMKAAGSNDRSVISFLQSIYRYLTNIDHVVCASDVHVKLFMVVCHISTEYREL